MTQTTNDLDQPVPTDDDDEETPLSVEEIEHLRREYAFAPGGRATPDEFPRLTNLSVSFIVSGRSTARSSRRGPST